MPIQLACPHCRTRYQLPDAARGKKFRCKKCSREFLAGKAAAAPAPPPPPPVIGSSATVRRAVGRKRSLLLPVLGCVGALLLLCAGGTVAGGLYVLSQLKIGSGPLANDTPRPPLPAPPVVPADDNPGPAMPPPPDEPMGDPGANPGPGDVPPDPPAPNPPDPPAPPTPTPTPTPRPRPNPGPRPAPKEFSKEDLAKLKIGMTEAEVLEMLGPPAVVGQSGKGNEKQLTWLGQGKPVELGFRDGMLAFGNVKLQPAGGNPAGGGVLADAVNQMNYNKIRRNMPENAVLELLGQPTRTQRLGGPGTRPDKACTWEDKGQTINVKFDRGKVVDKENGQKWPTALGPTEEVPIEPLTKEKYDKVKAGMSEKEMLAVLGLPTDFDKIPPREAVYDKFFVWQDPMKKQVWVFLAEGKVVDKRTSEPWPKDFGKANVAAPAPMPEPPKADAISQALADLKAIDQNKRNQALRTLAATPFDPARAEEVSKALEGAAGRGASDLVWNALNVWATKENVPFLVRTAGVQIKDNDVLDDRRGPRTKAMGLLAKLKDSEGAPPVAQLLRSTFDREEAAKALLAMGPEAAEKEVLKYYNDKNLNAQAKAREVLKAFKTSDAAIFGQCLEDLESRDLDVRDGAALAFGKLEVNAAKRREVALALDKVLERGDRASGAAVIALKKWATVDNVPTLMKMTGHMSEDMRREALAALKAVGPEAEKAVLPGLEDTNLSVQLAACGVLKEIGTRESLPALQMAAKDKNRKVAQAAQEAVQAIQGRK